MRLTENEFIEVSSNYLLNRSRDEAPKSHDLSSNIGYNNYYEEVISIRNYIFSELSSVVLQGTRLAISKGQED